MSRVIVIFVFLSSMQTIGAQSFSIESVNDSLSYLVLTTDSTSDRHRLPWHVYQMCTGDVDGDGSIDAMVGVVKTTRFDHTMAKRLFIFKNYKGRIRALWMGSKLGGVLEDFRFSHGKVITLQSTTDGRYAVMEHLWRKFGLGFSRFIVANVSRDEAVAAFEAE